MLACHFQSGVEYCPDAQSHAQHLQPGVFVGGQSDQIDTTGYAEGATAAGAARVCACLQSALCKCAGHQAWQSSSPQFCMAKTTGCQWRPVVCCQTTGFPGKANRNMVAPQIRASHEHVTHSHTPIHHQMIPPLQSLDERLGEQRFHLPLAASKAAPAARWQEGDAQPLVGSAPSSHRWIPADRAKLPGIERSSRGPLQPAPIRTFSCSCLQLLDSTQQWPTCLEAQHTAFQCVGPLDRLKRTGLVYWCSDII